MTLELYKPEEAEQLHNILTAAIDAKEDSDPTRRQRLVQMEMVDSEALARYAEQYLSNPEYMHNQTREEAAGFLEFSARAGSVGKTEDEKAQMDESLALIRRNPHLSKTFGVVSDIVYQYFHDLEAVSTTLEGEEREELQAATKNMLAEAEVGFFSRELLPYMFYGMSEESRGVKSIEGMFEKALTNAQGKGAFRMNGTCPFGNKITSVMDLAPQRDPNNPENVDIVGQKPCALPTFIFNEILQDMRASLDVNADASHD